MTRNASTSSDQRRLNSISLDRHLLDELALKGVISPDLRQASLDWLHPSRAWAQWAMVLMLAFGTGLILAGIVFFFAFNWASIPDLAKLGMIEAGLIAAALGAWFITLKRLSGQLLLLVASTLVGVFLATFGQIYQSGADPWQLFALWALLITPWTLLSRFSALWLIWWALINIALMLWWDEALGSNSALDAYLSFTFSLLNGSALVLREGIVRLSAKRGGETNQWLGPVWTRWLLVAATLGCLFPLLIEFVSAVASGEGVSGLVGPVGCVLLAGAYLYFRYVDLDIPVLAMALLVACLLFLVGLAVFLDNHEADALITTLLTGIAAIGSFGAAAGYLRKLLQLVSEVEPTEIEAMNGEQHGD
ncbi:DUF2157 domain-containing protein [Cohaesibacter sp. ES.047]|uniref:DUF2157 domain-containing protein n=1 Tax=Cohaesibacter sp. ES.047 TaxID=1798205 RepID=UPI0012FD6DC4|nr:DUF2157 domain-containing protein [Cohaesibacter sp. ES.047]